MADRMTREQRHNCMSRIRSDNTKPEIALRKELFRAGFRYRINVKGLPGRPDIVLPRYKTCIFVNGCFWHAHKGCGKYVLPKTHVEFWETKAANNRERDLRNYRDLEALDWRVITVWECELSRDKLEGTVSDIGERLHANRAAWLEESAERKRRNEEWKLELAARKERLLELSREADSKG